MSTVRTQETVEQWMADLGASRQRREIEKASASGYMAATHPGRQLTAEAAGVVSEAITNFVAEEAARTGKGGKPRAQAVTDSLACVDLLGADKIAVICVRAAISKLHKERHTQQALAAAVGKEIEQEILLIDQKAQNLTRFNTAKRRAKRFSSPVKKRGKAFQVLKEQGWEADHWTSFKRVGVGLLFLQFLSTYTDLVRFETVYNSKKRRRTTYVELTDEALDYLARSTDKTLEMFPVYMPSVEPPVDWETPRRGGLKTDVVRHRPFVKPCFGRPTSYYEQSDMGDVFKAANTLQCVPWVVNRPVLEAVEYLLEADPERLGVRSDRHIIRARRDTWVAREFEHQTCYMVHFADWRGRLYPLSSYLHNQGWDLGRGLIQFQRGKPIEDETAADWLRIHGANSFGVDKCAFSERLEWVAKNEDSIRSVATDPLGDQWWTEADKPAAFLSFCLDYDGFLDNGFGHTSRVPVALDGSNNGLQILSMLLRDEIGAKSTNCTPSDEPADTYQDVSDAVEGLLREDSDPLATTWLEWFGFSRLPRSMSKRPAMTLAYGVTHYAVHQYVREWYQEIKDTTGKAVIEGDPYPATLYLAQKVWAATRDVVVGAKAGMEWLQGVARVCSENDVDVEWMSPSGFPCRQAYRKRDRRTIQFVLGGSARVRQKLRCDTEDLSSRTSVQGISPNFVHSLDAAALHLTVNATSDRVRDYAMIHDSYGVPAADASYMAESLREVFIGIFEDDQLHRFREQQLLRLPPGTELPDLPTYGTYNVQDLRDADYFFA